MKSLASSEMSLNSSSSKFHWQPRMLLSVSLSSSPRNGDKPLSLDHNGAQLRDAAVRLSVCVFVCVHLQLTACRWWHQGSTCLWGMKQTHSWWLQGLEIQAFQSWPSASLWVCTSKTQAAKGKRLLTVKETNLSSTKRWESYLLARPKSIILILLVALLTHRMFSGWKRTKIKLCIKKQKQMELFWHCLWDCGGNWYDYRLSYVYKLPGGWLFNGHDWNF